MSPPPAILPPCLVPRRKPTRVVYRGVILDLPALKRTLDLIRRTDDTEFHMGHFFALVDASGEHPIVADSAEGHQEDVNRVDPRNHQCQSVACLAGSVQWRFAQTEHEWAQRAELFARNYLFRSRNLATDQTAKALFFSQALYLTPRGSGRSLAAVSREHVVAFLDGIHRHPRVNFARLVDFAN